MFSFTKTQDGCHVEHCAIITSNLIYERITTNIYLRSQNIISIRLKSLYGDNKVSQSRKDNSCFRTLVLSHVNPYCPYEEISVRTCANMRYDLLLVLTLAGVRRINPSRHPFCLFGIFSICWCNTNYPVWIVLLVW